MLYPSYLTSFLVPDPPCVQSLRDSMTKEFKGQLRAVQKKHDEAMQTVQKDWKKERQDLREKLKGELQTQVETYSSDLLWEY